MRLLDRIGVPSALTPVAIIVMKTAMMMAVTETKLIYDTLSKVRGIVSRNDTTAIIAPYATTHIALLEMLFSAIPPERACDPATNVTYVVKRQSVNKKNMH